jgi:hypothetical protein
LFERLLVEARAAEERLRAAMIPDNTPNDTKGEVMKTSYVRFLAAFFGLAALAVASRAQEVDQVIVKVPYEFVVAGKTLPAGNYRINRISTSNVNELALTNVDNRTGVLLVSGEVVPTREDKPALSFERVGDQYFLSKIETAEHIFTIPVSTKANQLVALKKQASPSASSSSGSN